MKYLPLLFPLLLLCGCVTRAATVVIPKNCVRVRITDFTKPCQPLPNGDAMCDRVRIHPTCTAVK